MLHLEEPLVSVVIPTFGRAALLRRAIDSVVAQTWTSWELIIVVDGIDQTSHDVAYAINDPRIKTVSHSENLGAGLARDAGAAVSRGRWVAFLDDDDEWLPTKLERQIKFAVGDNIIVSTMYRTIGKFGSLIRPTIAFDGSLAVDEWLFGRQSWLKGGEAMIQTSSLMFPRELLQKLQFCDFPQHEEWEIVIRASKQFGYRLVMVPEALVIYNIPDRTYPWTKSLEWAEKMRPVLSPEAYSGFLLATVTQGLPSRDRKQAFPILLRRAFAGGQPTIKQLFAFSLICLLPHDFRRKLRGCLSRTMSNNKSTSPNLEPPKQNA